MASSGHVPLVAMPIPSRNSQHPMRRTTSRSNSQKSSDSDRPQEPLSIPGARLDEAPPPLPPPRFNEDLANGIDTAWGWGNIDHFNGQSKLAPIKPGSSMFGGYLSSKKGSTGIGDKDDMEVDIDFDRRGSTVSTIRSPSQTELMLGGPLPDLVRRPPSPSTTSQRSVPTLLHPSTVGLHVAHVQWHIQHCETQHQR